MLWSFAIVGLDHGPCNARHLVNAAVPEVGNLLGMAERPASINRRTGVPSVSGRGDVPGAHRCSKALMVDESGEAAISQTLEPAIPARSREPNFDCDRGVTGR